jgi:hypothetical protein
MICYIIDTNKYQCSMGKLIHGINGPVQGKVGSVIGSSWKGIPYVKGPYKKRTEKTSAKELANRHKFGVAQAWLQPVLNFVRQGFKGYSPTSEGFVAAKSWLLKYSFEGEGLGAYINPALAQLSFGDLPLSPDITVELTEAGELLFTWSTAPVEGSSAKDQVMLLAYDIENKFVAGTITGQFRNVGADRLVIRKTKGYTYHLYMAFTADDRSRQSHSVYLGAITV